MVIATWDMLRIGGYRQVVSGEKGHHDPYNQRRIGGAESPIALCRLDGILAYPKRHGQSLLNIL
jgi:hypothetical protein